MYIHPSAINIVSFNRNQNKIYLRIKLICLNYCLQLFFFLLSGGYNSIMSSPSKHRSKRQSRYKRLLHKRLPITKWLPEYNSEKALADLIAGITVGLTVIPQALAYATLAGLSPQVMLYS